MNGILELFDGTIINLSNISVISSNGIMMCCGNYIEISYEEINLINNCVNRYLLVGGYSLKLKKTDTCILAKDPLISSSTHTEDDGEFFNKAVELNYVKYIISYEDYKLRGDADTIYIDDCYNVICRKEEVFRCGPVEFVTEIVKKKYAGFDIDLMYGKGNYETVYKHEQAYELAKGSK